MTAHAKCDTCHQFLTFPRDILTGACWEKCGCGSRKLTPVVPALPAHKPHRNRMLVQTCACGQTFRGREQTVRCPTCRAKHRHQNAAPFFRGPR